MCGLTFYDKFVSNDKSKTTKNLKFSKLYNYPKISLNNLKIGQNMYHTKVHNVCEFQAFFCKENDKKNWISLLTRLP